MSSMNEYMFIFFFFHHYTLKRAIRLKPAFVACQLGDFDSLAEMALNQEIFGSLTIPTSEERILCLNATESAIREQTFLHLAAFYGHLGELFFLNLLFPMF